MSKMELDKAGFVGQPESELDVAYLLGLAQGHLPFPFVVTAINDTFPDCEGVDPTTGKRITIELEVHSRLESPIPVVSLRRLFESTAALRHRFIYRPRPESVRGQLQALQAVDPLAHAVVSHFLNVILADLRQRVPAVVVDDTLTRHFSVRYGSGKGLLGIYPSGRLVSAGIDDTVKTYGDSVTEATRALREAVSTVGVLRTEHDGVPVIAALERLMRTIDQSQRAPNG